MGASESSETHRLKNDFTERGSRYREGDRRLYEQMVSSRGMTVVDQGFGEPRRYNELSSSGNPASESLRRGTVVTADDELRGEVIAVGRVMSEPPRSPAESASNSEEAGVSSGRMQTSGNPIPFAHHRPSTSELKSLFWERSEVLKSGPGTDDRQAGDGADATPKTEESVGLDFHEDATKSPTGEAMVNVVSEQFSDDDDDDEEDDSKISDSETDINPESDSESSSSADLRSQPSNEQWGQQNDIEFTMSAPMDLKLVESVSLTSPPTSLRSIGLQVVNPTANNVMKRLSLLSLRQPGEVEHRSSLNLVATSDKIDLKPGGLNTFGSIDLKPGDSIDLKPGGSIDLNRRGSIDLKPGGSVDLKPGGSIDLNPGCSIDLKPGGSVDLKPGGSIDLKPGGSIELKPGDSIDLKPGSSIDLNRRGSIDLKPGGSIDLNPGGSIDLNPGGSTDLNLRGSIDLNPCSSIQNTEKISMLEDSLRSVSLSSLTNTVEDGVLVKSSQERPLQSSAAKTPTGYISANHSLKNTLPSKKKAYLPPWKLCEQKNLANATPSLAELDKIVNKLVPVEEPTRSPVESNSKTTGRKQVVDGQASVQRSLPGFQGAPQPSSEGFARPSLADPWVQVVDGQASVQKNLPGFQGAPQPSSEGFTRPSLADPWVVSDGQASVQKSLPGFLGAPQPSSEGFARHSLADPRSPPIDLLNVQKLHPPPEPTANDSTDVINAKFGQWVAYTMSKISPPQSKLAQKLINGILKEASCGQLTEFTKVVQFENPRDNSSLTQGNFTQNAVNNYLLSQQWRPHYNPNWATYMNVNQFSGQPVLQYRHPQHPRPYVIQHVLNPQNIGTNGAVNAPNPAAGSTRSPTPH